MNLTKQKPKAGQALGKYKISNGNDGLPLSILEINRPLPNDCEAEAGVLQACFADPTAVDRACEFIGADDFYRRGHQIIFDRLVAIRKQDRWFTPTTILLSFQNHPEYDRLESIIFDLGPFITGQTSRHFAGIVQDLSHKRQIATTGIRMIENAIAITADADEILTQAKTAIEDLKCQNQR